MAYRSGLVCERSVLSGARANDGVALNKTVGIQSELATPQTDHMNFRPFRRAPANSSKAPLELACFGSRECKPSSPAGSKAG